MLIFDVDGEEYMRQIIELDEMLHKAVRDVGYDMRYLNKDFGLILVEQGDKLSYEFIDVEEHEDKLIDIYKYKNLENCKMMNKFEVRNNYIEIKNSKKLKEYIGSSKICIFLLADEGIRILV